MKFKLRKGHWKVAYRVDGKGNWKLVDSPKDGWAADPFLFEHNGETYLFAEIWSYRLGRGYLGCCRWNGNGFGEWKPVIQEPYHLSYPNVFEWNGKIYMLPEQYQSGDLGLYECQEFPYKWKKLKPFASDGEYVDSTILFKDGDAWLFTLRMNPKKHSEGELLRARVISPAEIGESEVIERNAGKFHRPGGHFFEEDGKIIRVAQNCENGYGSGLIFYEVLKCEDDGYQENEKKRLFPDDYMIEDYEINKCTGVHTYNIFGNLEVVDMKKMEVSIDELMFRIKRKLKRR